MDFGITFKGDIDSEAHGGALQASGSRRLQVWLVLRFACIVARLLSDDGALHGAYR